MEDGGRRRAARAREQEARLLVGWEKKVWPPVRPPDLSHAVGLTAAGLEERRWHGDLGLGRRWTAGATEAGARREQRIVAAIACEGEVREDKVSIFLREMIRQQEEIEK